MNGVGWRVAVVAMLLGACSRQLEPAVCGDGKLDSGERCDPEASDSPHFLYCVEHGLGSGEAVCNDQCQIVANLDVCALCGDGVAASDDALEQCDGDDLKGQICPSGSGQLGCRSDCTLDLSGCDPCGDGQFSNEVEECDASADQEDPGLGQTVACAELLGPKGAYSQGTVTRDDCSDECVYARDRCSYCGDGVLDPEYQDYGGSGTILQPAEVCDGDIIEQEALIAHCQDLCSDGGGTTLQLRCEVKCEPTCGGFEEQAWEDPVAESAQCCVFGGSPCDAPSGLPCCYALDHPEDADAACMTEALPKPLCRSG